MDRTPPSSAEGFRKASTCLIAAILPALLAVSCSSAPKSPQEDEIAGLRQEISRLSTQVKVLQDRLAAEGGTALEPPPANVNPMTPGSPPIEPELRNVTPPIASRTGKTPEADAVPGDPEAGLTRDDAVRSYRQAMILFRNGKHPEAILAFSAFLERYPDHPLAGGAQYHIGESYFLQGENRLAEKEFERVKEAYPRSSMISFALARLAQVQLALKSENQAAENRKLLEERFPGSPAIRLSARVEPSGQAPQDPEPRSAEPPAAHWDEPPQTAPLNTEMEN